MTIFSNKNEGVFVESRDLIRGVLIIFVVIDHNEYLRTLSNVFFDPLFFHVIGFFALSFCSIKGNDSGVSNFIWSRLRRYGTPFIAFYILYSIGLILIHSRSGDVIKFIFSDWSIGIFIGSYDYVKQGCGGAFMWFLPALIGFSALVRVGLDLKIRIALLFLSAIIYCIIGTNYFYFIKNMPFGIGVALYILPPLYLSNYIENKKFGILIVSDAVSYSFLLIVLVVCHVGLFYFSGQVEIGSILVPRIYDTFSFFFLFCGSMVTFSLVRRISEIGKFQARSLVWLSVIGKKSLIIYLLHQVALHGMYKVFGSSSQHGMLLNIILGCVALIVSVYFSLVVSGVIEKNKRIGNFIFPL